MSSIPPLSCPFGHLLSGGRVLAGWYPCACSGAHCGGHRTWICRACLELGRDPAAYIVCDGRHNPTEPGAGPQRGPELQT